MLEYKKDGLKALFVLLPTLVLMSVFTFYPIIRTLFVAFMDGYTMGVLRSNNFTDGWLDKFGSGSGDTHIGIGILSFKFIFSNKLFFDALKNTGILVLVSVPLTIIIALLISVALNGIKRGQSLYQTIFFLPYVTNTMALGLTFSALFASESGLINSLLISLGADPVPWLTSIRPVSGGDPILSKYWSGLFVIMMYSIWNGLAFKIMVFLSGLQSIDKQYYQAAQIDATSKNRVLRKITVPLLSPMISYISITSFIGAFKIYSSIIAIFNGEMGPSDDPYKYITIVGFIYYFTKGGADKTPNGQPRAAATAIVLFAIIMTITLIQNQINKRKVHY